MLIYLALIDSEEGRSKFEIIYTAYKNLMLYSANKILGDTRDTEDVVHQAFLKIIEIIDEIETPKCPQTRSLCVTIVERKAIDLYRKRQRHSTVSMDEEYINVPAQSEIDDIPVQTDIGKAISMLPTRYRELLLLKYDNGFSEAEIAKILSMSPANVKKTIQRAKAKLSKILDEQGVLASEDNG